MRVTEFALNAETVLLNKKYWYVLGVGIPNFSLLLFRIYLNEAMYFVLVEFGRSWRGQQFTLCFLDDYMT